MEKWIREVRKKTITKTEAGKLFSGKTIKAKLKIKEGKPYTANVVFNLDKNWIEFAK